MDYCKQIVGEALSELISHYDFQKRLTAAALNVSIAPATSAPNRLRIRIEELQDRLRGPDNNVKQTISAMSLKEKLRITEEIMLLYGLVCVEASHTSSRR